MFTWESGIAHMQLVAYLTQLTKCDQCLNNRVLAWERTLTLMLFILSFREFERGY